MIAREISILSTKEITTMRTGTQNQATANGQSKFEDVKRRIHGKLVDKLDLSKVGELKGDTLKREIRTVVEHLCDAEETLLNRQEREKIVEEVIDEVLGLGPLELILKDAAVSDILINGPNNIYV
jgi:pilus assembly protein CpaF